MDWNEIASLSIYGFETFLLVATKRDNILSIINEQNDWFFEINRPVISADSYLATSKDSSL